MKRQETKPRTTWEKMEQESEELLSKYDLKELQEMRDHISASLEEDEMSTEPLE